MPKYSDRLSLPLGDFEGARAVGTIKTIAPGVFETVETRFPLAIQEMLVSVNNTLLFLDNDVVYL